MFGLNDNNSQTTNTNLTGTASAMPSSPSPVPDNPFAETDSAVPPQSPALPQVTAPTVSPTTPPPSSPAVPITPPVTAPTPPVITPTQPPGGDLLDLKQQALQNLQPLVSHLDQSPEEKFKTTMMLIQATDNSALVKQAYEAANQITDEKVRAQALLDVVNEINYFTQQNGEQPPAKP
jgi:hypothetical protein